jgi:hypothetical protein
MVATNTIMLLSPPSTSSQLLFLLDVIFLSLFLLVLVSELHFFFYINVGVRISLRAP